MKKRERERESKKKKRVQETSFNIAGFVLIVSLLE